MVLFQIEILEDERPLKDDKILLSKRLPPNSRYSKLLIFSTSSSPPVRNNCTRFDVKIAKL
jgi:hypothetical protein